MLSDQELGASGCAGSKGMPKPPNHAAGCRALGGKATETAPATPSVVTAAASAVVSSLACPSEAVAKQQQQQAVQEAASSQQVAGFTTRQLLSDFLAPGDSGSPLTTSLAEVMAIAEAHNLSLHVYQFSELAPGQSLQEHVVQQMEGGACPHPAQKVGLGWHMRGGRQVQ